MATSALALVGLVAGAGVLVGRLELSGRAVRVELRCARAAGVLLAAFVAGVGAWLWAGTPRTPGLARHDLFHVGAIDLAGGVALCAALWLFARALRRGADAAARLAG